MLPVAVVGDAVGLDEGGRRPSPSTSRISSAVQVKVLPSTPSVSASWLAANAPSSRRQLADHVVERPGRDVRVARRRPSARRRGCRRGRAGRCRRASARSAGRARSRRSSSGGSRRRAGRGSRRRPSRRGCAARRRADARRRSRPRAGAGTRSSSAAGTSGRRPSRRSCASKLASIAAVAVSRSARVGASLAGRRAGLLLDERIDQPRARPRGPRARSSRQARATPARTCRNAGIP